LASGLDGIANQIEPPPEFNGDAYTSADIQRVPTSLREAVTVFSASESARRLLGDEVVEHYSNFYRSECDAYDSAVTDWERHRYFERI
jgi:glutamine synthetase